MTEEQITAGVFVRKGDKFRVREKNPVFGGRVGTVISLEVFKTVNSDEGIQYVDEGNSADYLPAGGFRVCLDIDITGWARGDYTGPPCFWLRELEPVEEEGMQIPAKGWAVVDEMACTVEPMPNEREARELAFQKQCALFYDGEYVTSFDG